MKQQWKNILLIGGSGQNVGKTTFINRVLEQPHIHNPVAVKISHHFYPATPGLALLSESENYQLFEETDRSGKKDSSRFLQHGAKRSFYVQANDEHLAEAFIALLPYLEAEHPVLIESASLHKHIAAGLFLFIYNKNDEQKPATKANLKVADFVVHSDGKTFDLPPSQLKFENEWRIVK
jgi:hypothetical protein